MTKTYGRKNLTIKQMRSKRADAIASNHSYYFTGKACKNGHIAPRATQSSQCVECQKMYYKKNYIPKKRHMESDEEKLRKRKAYLKKYYEKNKEKILARHRKWAKANRDKENKRYRERYRKNPEKFIAKSKNYYYLNREEILKKKREYRRKNKEKISQQNRAYYLKTRKLKKSKR